MQEGASGAKLGRADGLAPYLCHPLAVGGGGSWVPMAVGQMSLPQQARSRCFMRVLTLRSLGQEPSGVFQS